MALLEFDQNNVERKHAIHESRLASVKASLSLSTPRRMDFMDKRLSKNFHMRRHHKQVVHENLKLLRALEEIHSRSSTAVVAGTESLTAGGGGASMTTGGQKGRKVQLSKSASNTTGSTVSRKKLSSLLARKRNVKAAIVARENQKMMEVRRTGVRWGGILYQGGPGTNSKIDFSLPKQCRLGAMPKI